MEEYELELQAQQDMDDIEMTNELDAAGAELQMPSGC